MGAGALLEACSTHFEGWKLEVVERVPVNLLSPCPGSLGFDLLQIRKGCELEANLKV